MVVLKLILNVVLQNSVFQSVEYRVHFMSQCKLMYRYFTYCIILIC